MSEEYTEGEFSGFKFPPKEDLIPLVQDLTKPIAQRMRSIFYLRTLGGDDAVEALCKAIIPKEGTCLFRHEIAYVLGQMRAAAAIPTLTAILEDSSDDPIVRHECGEALGAIAHESSIAVLEKFSSDPAPEVAETCQIALRRVKWIFDQNKDNSETVDENPFESIDPAPAKRKPLNTEVPAIQRQLVDQSLPLFERYKAMFSLRNNGSDGACRALCTGFSDPSPLFRHEVAYVLGQLSNTEAIEALKARVVDEKEHDMVRHEAAEALGAIGTPSCVEFLKEYSGSDAVILRESCEVALDVVDYWADKNTEDTTVTA